MAAASRPGGSDPCPDAGLLRGAGGSRPTREGRDEPVPRSELGRSQRQLRHRQPRPRWSVDLGQLLNHLHKGDRDPQGFPGSGSQHGAHAVQRSDRLGIVVGQLHGGVGRCQRPGYERGCGTMAAERHS